MRSPTRLVTAGLVLVGVAFGVSGLASADSGTVIYSGCENVATGIVRLLPANLPAPYNNSCNTTAKNPLLLKKAISWNQVGPTGPAGVTGPTGPIGLTGTAGPAGPDRIRRSAWPTSEGARHSDGRIISASVPKEAPKIMLVAAGHRLVRASVPER